MEDRITIGKEGWIMSVHKGAEVVVEETCSVPKGQGKKNLEKRITLICGNQHSARCLPVAASLSW